MKVDRIAVSLEFAQETDAGRKCIRLHAEGTPDLRQTWQQAAAELHHDLGLTLRGLWRSAPATESKQGTLPAMPPRNHWCERHETEWKERVNKETGLTFYSHYIKETKSWCNEPV